MSASPGSTEPPLPSMWRLPAGTCTSDDAPMATIRWPSTTMLPRSMGTPPLPSMILTFVIAIGFALDQFAASPSSAMQMYRQIAFAVKSRTDGRSLCMILSLYDLVLARPRGTDDRLRDDSYRLRLQ